MLLRYIIYRVYIYIWHLSFTPQVASNPCLYDNDDVVADVTPLGEDLGKVRLVRLYWRFMVGSVAA